ncbi:hypothetical protein [Roseateles oligotrophus]|uniref:Uncharacterized protein n=1 Tax=Roseateles oligotrophus TaxID=1769250 RepID=A0ABT2YBA2_9BURK|nr:hypothetical protein [Roseateles oligotrophus]MCV2367576.1 hypothetical protein [Roseateles oligotrophus]
MKRRSLLKLGLGGAVLLGVVGGGMALLRPGLVGKQMSPSARELMRAVALSVMDGLWPTEGPARDAAVQAHLDRVDANIGGYPAAVRAELSQLFALLGSSGGRLALIGMSQDWREASAAEIQKTLNELRLSSLDVRQQIYHALRDLNTIAFFTEPDHWSLTGYPGPRQIP